MSHPEIIHQWLDKDGSTLQRYMRQAAEIKSKTNSAYDSQRRELSEMPLCFVVHDIFPPPPFNIASGYVRLDSGEIINHYFYKTPSADIKAAYIIDICAGQFFNGDKKGDRIVQIARLVPDNLILHHQLAIVHGYGSKLKQKLGLEYVVTASV